MSNDKKSALALIAFIIIFSSIYSNDNNSTKPKPKDSNTSKVMDNSSNSSKEYQNVIEYFISDAEPKVKDAVWTQKNWLYLGVYNDGTKRDGLAQYACMVLNDMGFKGIHIKIIDLQKMYQTKKWVKLGYAYCN